MGNNILTGDCFELIKDLPDNSIDLIITSPPYADIVNYGKNISIQKPQDYCDWLLPLFNEIYRVLKPSGSFILNINDNCSKGYRNPFIYELIYRSQKETKLKFYDTYICHKRNGIPNGSPKRFRNTTEFIFHFVKDQKELKFNMDRVLEETNIETKGRYNRNGLTTPQGIIENGKRDRIPRKIKYLTGSTNKTKEGYELPITDRIIPDKVRPDNVVRFSTAGAARDNSIKHPAPFHKDLPKYYINLLTDDGDTILDPFGGIMTTGLACNEIGNRNFIGFELNEKYAEFGKKRISGEDYKTEQYVINQYDEEGNFIKSFNTTLEIEKHFDKPCVNNIKNILRGFKRNFTLFGYEWKLEKNNYGKI
jgi:site-specific DNA-methyltransferase (adenine-specific)/site-specific DNA-methyltransferase (cytosine-N4-specific)